MSLWALFFLGGGWVVIGIGMGMFIYGLNLL